MITGKKYEVLKFMEYDGKSRVVMDCVRGRLLVHRLDDRQGITKEIVFNWFNLLADELEKYHRCKKEQCYRYINPYSVLVTEEEKILLLDLSAGSNGFVLKNMQRPAMREHFVKPIIHIRESTKTSLDFYGFGKTIQFILARTESYILLSKMEEYILSGVIKKCLGENSRKKFDSLKQVKKELPKSHHKNYEKQKKRIILIVLIVALLLAIVFAVSM
ncbi:hypothetical protein BN3456_00665 [Clostridium sp. C105KSO13]|nr:hypothetical protein BN3456_00665 [Clostridium sp. C105KSO13]